MDLGLLVLRGAVGPLMAAHGAGKLFGWFGAGYGVAGTAGYLESLGFRPGRRYALLAGATELVGGLGLALGAATPLASAATIGQMVTAARTAHAGKGLWVTDGGAEYPLTIAAISAALAHTGPGKYSVDGALGIDRHGFLPGAAALALGLGAAQLALASRTTETPPTVAADPTADPASADGRVDLTAAPAGTVGAAGT